MKNPFVAAALAAAALVNAGHAAILAKAKAGIWSRPKTQNHRVGGKIHKHASGCGPRECARRVRQAKWDGIILPAA